MYRLWASRIRAINVWLMAPLLGLTGALVVMISVSAPVAQAATANSNLNFQARLLTSTGAIVPDGNYNIEFKIYKSQSANASGQGVCVGGVTDDCLWIETRTGGNVVSVVNGYFSVNLGSVNAFSNANTTINWDNQLWLTMRIGGTGAPSWDSEMTNSGNRIQLTGVPLAFRANALAVTGTNEQILQFASTTFGQTTTISLPDPGATTATVCYQGATACGFATGTTGSYIQNQVASLQAANFRIQSASNSNITATITGASGQLVDIMDVATSAANVVTVGSAGATTFQNATDSSTGFNVKNSGGTTVLGIDTSNLIANFTNLQATGAISLQNGQGASIQLRTVSSSLTGLTESNVITDSTPLLSNSISLARSASLQGDGRQPPDSSTGIWQGTTNLLPNGGFESNTTNWAITTGGDVLTQDSSRSKFGSFSMKESVGGTGFEGAKSANITVSASTTYTASAWFYITNSDIAAGKGVAIDLQFGGVTDNRQEFRPTTPGWNRFSVTATSGVGVSIANVYATSSNTVPATTFWVDGVQLEQKSYATPYVETTIAAASRAGARIQAPATALTASSGWLAVHGRFGFSSAQANGQRVFWFGDGTGGTANRLAGTFQPTALQINENLNSSATETLSLTIPAWSVGDTYTAIFAWTNGNLYIWYYGTALTSTSAVRTTIPTGLTTLDIGSTIGTSGFLDGDIMWSAMGTGSLTTSNVDATTLYKFGNYDPTLAQLNTLNSSASTATFAWDGEGTQYSGSNGAYVSQSQISIDDVNLTHTGNGSLTLQGSTNSTTAFQVQNVAGNPLLGIDTTNTTVNLGITGSLAVAGTVNIANTNGSAVESVNIGSLSSTSVTNIQGGNSTGGVNLLTSNNGTITIASQASSTTNTVVIGAGGSSTNTNNVSINNTSGPNSSSVTIGGTGAYSGTITLGQSTGASNIVNIGSGNLSGGAFTQTVNIANGNSSGTGGEAVNIGNGTPGSGTTNVIAIGTGGSTTGTVGVTIGSNANAAHTTAIQGGSGATAITLTPQTTGQIVIGAATGTGQITLGSSSTTQTVVVGGGAGVSTVQIAGGSAANVVQIANVQTGGSVSIGAAMTTGTITLGNTGTTTIQGGTTTIKQTSGANSTTLAFASPTAAVTYNLLTATAGSYNICTTAFVCGVGGTTNNYLVQVPTSNSANTAGANVISPTAAGIVGLTINGTTNATSADVLDIASGVPVSQTSTNGILFNQNSAGTTTNGIQIQRTSGTLTNGLVFSGTIGTDIVGNAKAINITAAGTSIWQTTSGNLTLQASAASSQVTVDSGSTGTVNLGNTNATVIGIGGASTATTTIGGGNVAHTIHIGDGATGTNNITIGTTNSTSATTVQAGTGNLNLLGSQNVQIENSVGTAFVTADTTNLQINTGNLQSTGAISLQNQQGASIQLRTVSGSAALTENSTVISDNTAGTISRSAGLQGDGRQAPDSSTGIWETTTNLVPNGGGETNFNGFVNNQRITPGRTTGVSEFGQAAFMATVISPGGQWSGEWRQTDNSTRIAATAGNTYTFSTWAKAASNYGTRAETINIAWIDGSGAILSSSTANITNISTSWVRYQVSGTAPVNTASVRLTFTSDNSPAIGEVYYFDGVQFEQKGFATPYVETTTATASRATTATVTAPATLLSQTSGWVAARVRMGISSTNTVASGNVAVLSLDDNTTTNRLQLVWSPGSTAWQSRRCNLASGCGSSASVSDSFSAGAIRTVILKWDASNVYVSVNGSALSTTLTANSNVLASVTNLYLGGAGATTPFDGDILWEATGTGSLSDADAATINRLGNTDPTVTTINSIDSGAVPTLAWDGESAAYSSNANAYTNQSQLSIDDVNLTHNGNGSLVLQGATNSTAAFQVQDNAGNIFFTVDTSTPGVSIGATGSSTKSSTIHIADTNNATGTQLVTIGTNANTANTVTIDAGTGANSIAIGNSTTAHNIAIGNGGTSAQTLNIGSTSSTSATTINGGVNSTNETLQLQVAASGFIGVGTANSTKTIDIGSVGSTAGASTIHIADTSTTTNVQAVTIGSNSAAAHTLVLRGGNGAGAITLSANGGSNTGTIVTTVNNSTLAFQVQDAAAAPIFMVDTTSTDGTGTQVNYLTYPGFESGSFSNAAAGWAASGTGTISQNTNRLHAYNGLYSAAVSATGANAGLTTGSFAATAPAGTYLVSFYAKISAGTMASTLFTVTATPGNGIANICSPVAGVTINSSGFQRLYCQVVTTGNMTTLTIAQNDSTTRTYYIDSVQVQGNSINGNTITAPSAYQAGAIQLRGVITNPVIIQSNANSTSAFQVANAVGSAVLNVDTLNNNVTISSSNIYQTIAIPSFVGGADITGTNTSASGIGSASATDTVYYGKYIYIVKSGDATPCSASAGSAIGCELQVYDASNPALPVYVGGVDSTGTLNSGIGNTSFLNIATSGHYLYIVKNGNATNCNSTVDHSGCELQVYDISNPASPAYVGGADSSGSTNSGTATQIFNGIAVSGSFAYVISQVSTTACSNTPGSAVGCEIKIFNIANPANPAYVAGMDESGTSNGIIGALTPSIIRVYGHYIYVINPGNATDCSTAGNAVGCELQVYDVSNPYSPVFVSGVDAGGTNNSVSGIVSSAFNDAAVSGRYVFVSKTASATACSNTAGSAIGCEVQVYDFNNPSSPVYVAGIDASGTVGSGIAGVSGININISGRYAYLGLAGNASTCSGTAGNAVGCELQIYDIATPTAPVYLTGTDVSGLQSGLTAVTTERTAINGRYLYMSKASNATNCNTANNASGCELQIYDISGVDAVSVNAGSIYTGALTANDNSMFNQSITVAGGVTIGQSLQVNGGVGVAGPAIFQNSANSTSAFQIQNSSAQNLLAADTTNMNITVDGALTGQISGWSSGSAFGTGLYGATSVTANGYVYEIGGWTGSRLTTVRYSKLNTDGSNSAWTSTTSLPVALAFASSVTANGYVYEMGGIANSGVVSTVYYAKLNTDGSVGTWVQSSNSLPSVIDGSAAVVANGYVYMIGGNSAGGPVATVYNAKLNADGSIGAWTNLTGTPLPAVTNLATAVAANGYVYVMGGANGSGTPLSAVYSAQLNTGGTIGSWTTLSGTPLPQTLYSATSVVTNGYVYVMGGTHTSGASLSTVYYAQLQSGGNLGAWNTSTNTLLNPRMGATSVTANGYIYVIAGSSDGGTTYVGTVYWASTARLQVGSNLDLVGLQGGTLADPGDQSLGSTGGSIIAGNITAVGSLQIQGPANFASGLSATGNSAFTTAAFTTVLVNGSVAQTPPSPVFQGGADASGVNNLGSGTTASAFNYTAVYGHYTYVAKAGDGTSCATTVSGCELQVYDTSVPTAPTYLTGIDSSGNVNSGGSSDAMNELIIAGHYLYAIKNGNATNCNTAGDHSGCELQVYDLSNPWQPTYVGGGDAGGGTNTGTTNKNFSGMSVSGQYVYITTSTSGSTCSTTVATGCELEVWDVTNPAKPDYIGGADASGATNSGTEASGFTDVKVSGNYAYVIKVGLATDCHIDYAGCELQIYDITTPSAPTIYWAADSTGYNNGYGAGLGVGSDSFTGLAVYGSYIYVTKVANAATCSSTVGSGAGCELQIYNNSTTFAQYAGGVDSTGTLNSGVGNSGGFNDITIAGHYAYISHGGAGGACSNNAGSAIGCEMQIYDLSNPTSPTYSVGVDSSGTAQGSVTSGFTEATIVGHYLYEAKGASATNCNTANDANGCELQIYDLSGVDAVSVTAGSLQAGSLQVDNKAVFNNNITVAGAISIGKSLELNGDLGVAGSSLFKSMNNSNTALQIQNATGISILTADTLGYSASSGPTGLSTLPGSNSAGALSGAAGTTYYYKITAFVGGVETAASSELSFNGSGFTPISAPASGPSVAAGLAGNVTCNNTFGQGCRYEVTYLTANGETTGGPAGSILNQVSKQISLSNIPTGPAGTVGRNIYRSTNGGTFQLITSGTCVLAADNVTTSCIDNQLTPINSIPSSNTATTNLNVLGINWTGPAGATWYRVYSGTSSGGENTYYTTTTNSYSDSGSGGASGSVNSNTSSSLQLLGNSTIVKPTTDYTGAFQVQNAAGTDLFAIDTVNSLITLGVPSSSPVQLVLGIKNTSGDPAVCTNGAIYYNSSTTDFRGCTGGTWVSLVFAGTPTGTILATASASLPYGFLEADGSSMSRATYATLFSALDPSLGTFTITNAAPGVITLNGHGLIAGDHVFFEGGTISGLTADTVYCVVAPTTNTFELGTYTSSTYLTDGANSNQCGAAITTTGSQSGTFTMYFSPYGVADSTHFSLPDLRGRVPVGYTGDDTGKQEVSNLGVQEGLPVTTRNIAFHVLYTNPGASDGTGTAGGVSGPNVPNTKSSGDTNNENKPSFTTVNYIIKY
jgi:hypothetical protein